MPTITESEPSSGSRGHRHALGLVKVAAVLAAAALITAACGSSSPSATKKTSDNHHASASAATTTTTSTTTTPAPGPATTVAPSTKAVTATTVAPIAKAVTTTTAAKAPAPPLRAARSRPTRPPPPRAALTGIGSSSIVPFYGKALYEYHAANSGVTVNYSGSGSGPGVTAIEQNTASFGQSEVPMTAAQLAASKGPVLQVPVDLGGVSISYNGVVRRIRPAPERPPDRPDLPAPDHQLEVSCPPTARRATTSSRYSGPTPRAPATTSTST